MSDSPKVASAQRNVEAARARLLDTVTEIQSRIAPATLFDDVMSDVRERSADLARTAGTVARDRPATVASAAVAGIALLAHKPLWRLARKILGKSEATEPDAAS